MTLGDNLRATRDAFGFDRDDQVLRDGEECLGHLRRVSNIARALRRERPDISLVLVTNAPIAGLSHEDCECFSEVHQVPRERMAALLSSLPRGPVVIDTAVIPGVKLCSIRWS